MTRLRILCLWIASLHATALLAAAERNLSTTLLDEWVHNGPQIGGEEKGKCVWENGASLDFEFGYTNKGNGGLLIGGQLIRIFDCHDDGCYYEQEPLGLLKIELAVLDKTPLLILSGMARWEDYKGKAVIRREPILVILALNKKKQLEVVFENEGAMHAEVIRTDNPEKPRKGQSEWTDLIQREAEKIGK